MQEKINGFDIVKETIKKIDSISSSGTIEFRNPPRCFVVNFPATRIDRYLSSGLKKFLLYKAKVVSRVVL